MTVCPVDTFVVAVFSSMLVVLWSGAAMMVVVFVVCVATCAHALLFYNANLVVLHSNITMTFK